MAVFRFVGALSKHFKKIKMNVETPAQGLRILFAQNQNFKRDFIQSKMRMRIAGENIKNDELDFHLHRKINDDDVVLFVPVVEGAVEGITVGTWIMIGLTVASVALSIYMMSTMKTKTSAEAAEADKITNNSFTSIDNRIGQGKPVPILLGEMVVGSNVISLGIDTTNNMDWEETIG